MTGQTLYAVYNRDCCHVLGVHADRRHWEPTVDRMQRAGNWSLRTRVATDDDMIAVLRGDKCEGCDGARVTNLLPGCGPVTDRQKGQGQR